MFTICTCHMNFKIFNSLTGWLISSAVNLLWTTINKCFMFECLKFINCVGPVSIDSLSIDQQCHMISCKHDAMLSLAYWSLFLDQSTWGITLVKRQGNPPTSIIWSRSQVTISDIQCVGLSHSPTHHLLFKLAQTLWLPYDEPKECEQTELTPQKTCDA